MGAGTSCGSAPAVTGTTGCRPAEPVWQVCGEADAGDGLSTGRASSHLSFNPGKGVPALSCPQARETGHGPTSSRLVEGLSDAHASLAGFIGHVSPVSVPWRSAFDAPASTLRSADPTRARRARAGSRRDGGRSLRCCLLLIRGGGLAPRRVLWQRQPRAGHSPGRLGPEAHPRASRARRFRWRHPQPLPLRRRRSPARAVWPHPAAPKVTGPWIDARPRSRSRVL